MASEIQLAEDERKLLISETPVKSSNYVKTEEESSTMHDVPSETEQDVTVTAADLLQRWSECGLSEEDLNQLLVEHGIQFFNTKLPDGFTLFSKALMLLKLDMVKLLFERAKSENVVVDLIWKNQDQDKDKSKDKSESESESKTESDSEDEDEKEDVLTWAINHSSQESVEFILKILLERYTTVEQAAEILQRNFGSLFDRFPHLVEEYIKDDRFFLELGQFQVPSCVFDKEGKKPVAMTAETSAESDDASNSKLKEMWKSKITEWTDEADTKAAEHVLAVSKIVCIRNIASPGRRSFLETLLTRRASVNIFKSNLVKLVVEWNWQNGRSKECIVSIWINLMAALSFSVFAATFFLDEDMSDAYNTVATAAFICSGVFHIILVTREVCPPHKFLLLFAFGMLSNDLTVDDRSEFTGILTSLMCIEMWISLLWYLQPYSQTGPLISMMQYVFWDILSFTVMIICIVIGFGMAFLVLFSERYVEDDSDTFNTPHRSCETLFYAMLGEFDSDVFRSLPNRPLSWWSNVLFDLFLFLGAIVLLSLLISILGDTYDKVRLKHEAELFKCRARMITTCSGSLVDLSRFRIFYLEPALQYLSLKLKISLKALLGSVIALLVLLLVGAFAGDRVFGWSATGSIFRVSRYIVSFVSALAFNFGIMAYVHYMVEDSEEGNLFLHQLVPVVQDTKQQDALWQGKLLALETMIRTAIKETEEKASRNEMEYRTETSAIKQSIIQTAAQVEELKSQVLDSLREQDDRIEACIEQNGRIQETLSQILQRLHPVDRST